MSRLGPDYDFVKVLDFGLVKSHDTSVEGATQLTLKGVTTGTPAYMAPEMVLGKKGVDARADLYALGCVAYWLLTGQLVFEGKNPMEVLVHHVQDEPKPPSQRSEFEIPPALDELILCCLEKDPAKRPASAEELYRQLDACRLVRIPVKPATQSGESGHPVGAKRRWGFHDVSGGRFESM